MPLDNDKIKELVSSLRRPRGSIGDYVVQVVEFYNNYYETHGMPFSGTTREVANILGLPPHAVRMANSEIRSQWFIEQTGSTVPYQPRGRGLKNYMIINNVEALPNLEEGNRIKHRYNRTDVEGLHVLTKFQYEMETDPIKKALVDMRAFYLEQIREIDNKIDGLDKNIEEVA